eukprot:CAMPEP_0198518782 /NCGR_PEP_ID=MMETSP1462-20131121/19321_1 /TAXON_ID=1333877 /ORGANISM="Brandtodinium nutriculum, Strain RCC3387" /LENGTH=61 /DNA_ID=CAMNT_0044248379 /DNA_START=28 /DNA_END=209 /DNA_ORIENTATION=+
MSSEDNLRILFAEFSDHIANVLQVELSQQTVALRTIIQREAERQSQSAGPSPARPDEGAQR